MKKYLVVIVLFIVIVSVYYYISKATIESESPVNTIALSDSIFQAIDSIYQRSVEDFSDLVYPYTISIDCDKADSVSLDELIHIKSLIEMPPMGLGMFTEDFNDPDKDDARWFKRFDFSGDGKLDLILCMSAFAEERTSFLWINSGSKYKYCDNIWGNITRFVKDSLDGSFSIISVSGYCCAGRIGDYALYKPVFDSGKVKYKYKTSIEKFDVVEIPYTRIIPKSFFLPESTYLRASPYLLDAFDTLETEFDETPVYGNRLAMIMQGAKGFALSEKIDSVNHKWIFVKLNEGTKYSSTRYYGETKESKTGWVEEKKIKYTN